MLARCAYMSRSRLVEKQPEAGSRKWLVAELDKCTSLIVRKRDGRCVTCGSMKGLQYSHFFSRRYLSIRFDLRSCNAQCAGCNRRHNQDGGPYERYIVETYGHGLVAELHERRGSLEKITDEDLQGMLRQYRAMV
jgi:hypothetical protein